MRILYAILLLLCFLNFFSPANAQQISKEELLFLTPEWKGERFPDGQPKVPDNILKRMKQVTHEEAWAVMKGEGYQATNAPRTRYFAARYNSGSEVPETPQNLNGMPYGYTVSDIATAPGYTGNINGYSQFRRSTVIFSTAPEHFVTYSQTQ